MSVADPQESKKYLGDVIEVKAAHRFDVGPLERYLSDTIRGFAGPVTVRQFESGQSNLTYLVTTPSRAYVLRRRPPGVLLKSAHAVDREFLVMSKLWENGFSVPEPLVLCEDESVVGTMFYVMAHVPGRIFLQCWLPDLQPDERSAIFDSVNAVLARLHSLNYEALGLEDFGRPGNYFARQISRWSQQYESSRMQDIPEMDKLIAWLPGAIPAEDLARLIHGDFSFHNVLIHPTQPRVVAVLDWELSTIGHPYGDLMYHMMEWYRPEGSDARGTLAGRSLSALGIPNFSEYLAAYCVRAGLPAPANVAFYRAYNLFRVAAITQGIVARARDGTGVSANAAEFACRVAPLAQAAWREAREAGAS